MTAVLQILFLLTNPSGWNRPAVLHNWNYSLRIGLLLNADLAKENWPIWATIYRRHSLRTYWHHMFIKCQYRFWLFFLFKLNDVKPENNQNTIQSFPSVFTSSFIGLSNVNVAQVRINLTIRDDTMPQSVYSRPEPLSWLWEDTPTKGVPLPEHIWTCIKFYEDQCPIQMHMPRPKA